MNASTSSHRQRYQAAVDKQRRDRNYSKTPVPQRITAALDVQGLFGPEVDRACGVEEPTVDLWESGEMVPTPEQVEALACLTGFPVHYFYKPATEPLRDVWLCGDDGCEILNPSPPPPLADVVLLFPRPRQPTLF
jgi:hypothetical protein